MVFRLCFGIRTLSIEIMMYLVDQTKCIRSIILAFNAKLTLIFPSLRRINIDIYIYKLCFVVFYCLLSMFIYTSKLFYSRICN